MHPGSPSDLHTGSGLTLPLSGRFRIDDPGQGLIYGVRPEDILIDPTSQMRATVVVVEPTGSETHVVARAGDGEIGILLRERVRLKPGDQVGLRVRPGAEHLFSADSGRRLEEAGRVTQ
jgi:multiple sugar transport system ATP-binding protein